MYVCIYMYVCMYLSQVELDWKAWFASISESDKLNINGAALAGRISRAAVYYSSPSAADATLPSSSPSLSPSPSPSSSSHYSSFCDRYRPASKSSSVYSGSGSNTVWVSMVVVLVVTAIISYRWLFKGRTGQAHSSLDSESASENTGNIPPILSSTTEVEIPPPSTQDKENLSGVNSSQNNLSSTISTTSTMQGGDSVAKNEFSSAIHTTTSVAEVAEPPPTDGSANLPEQMSPPTTTKKKKSGGKKSSKSKESGFDSPPPSGSRSGSTTSNTTPPATGSGHPQSHKHYLRSTTKKG